jgi:hypothetical protein
MAALSPDERHEIIARYVDCAKVNWAHICIAQLVKEGYVDRILTTNFDPLVIRAAALLGPLPAVYDLASSRFDAERIHSPALVYLHGQHAASGAAVSLQPQHGKFLWRYPRLKSLLATLWRPGDWTVLVQGAVMAFEANHGLTTDDVAGRQFWAALLKAVAHHQVTRRPYYFLDVSTSLPETLRVWRDGRVIFTSLANTGIASRPTALGTFPVYARYLSTTMSGTNPDGSHYDDPGVPYVAYFNGGDAVHGFLRAAYGYPQSLGCVELPYAAAAVVFRYDPLGTLVMVH